MKVTENNMRLAAAFLESTATYHYGYELNARLKRPAYETLHDWTEAGWLETKNEDTNPTSWKLPPRTLYLLTPKGWHEIHETFRSIPVSTYRGD